MRAVPSFFERIRAKAAATWDQLDSNPELAAPWKQLFNQVKSPRHVLSELLQNAEDAGAHVAAARLEDDCFVFEHDGHDFQEDEFQSLCRFAFSNKRSLLTIGFRGIGFRTLFSLGDDVRVTTPTLACSFRAERFTAPIWDSLAPAADRTRITVRIASAQLRDLLDRELARWAESPTPLLFFRSIREMQFGDVRIAVERLGDGPCERCDRVRLAGLPSDLFVMRSEAEAFPDECLDEVRVERGDPSMQLPPAEVVIVSGTRGGSGRVHAVLPTGITLGIPVDCHAPFLQDPGRMSVKDPAASPTNRWLLQRVGRLLATSLASWVGNPSLNEPDSAEAYVLLPPRPDPKAGGLAAAATTIVLEAFEQRARAEAIVLCSDGYVRESGSTDALPPEAVEVWGAEEALRLAGSGASHALAPAVAKDHATRLCAWGMARAVSLETFMRRLVEGNAHPRVPDQLERLVALWAQFYRVTSPRFWEWPSWWMRAMVVPVEGRAELHSAADVIPTVPERPPTVAQEEWERLLGRVRTLDRRWAQWAQWAESATTIKRTIGAMVAAGVRIGESSVHEFRKGFAETKLTSRSGGTDLIASAARALRDADAAATAWIELTHAAWRLGANLGSPSTEKSKDPFLFVCRDGELRGRADGLIARIERAETRLFPANWAAEHVLSDEYEMGIGPHEVGDWRAWLMAVNGGRVAPFPQPMSVRSEVYQREALQTIEARGGTEPASLPFRNPQFRLDDWDWQSQLVEHWHSLAAAQPGIWAVVVAQFLRALVGRPGLLSPECLTMRVRQISAYDTVKPVEVGAPRAAWLEMLRAEQCLPDEFGKPHQAAELYRRTPDTNALIGVEPFVGPELDVADTAGVLDLLGVRSTPTGAGSIVDRVAALANTDVPVGHLRDLYKALDRVAARLSTDEVGAIRTRFEELALVRTTDGWRRAQHAFRGNPFGLPGVGVLHSDIDDLGQLWARLGIRDEPSEVDVLDWLKMVPLDEGLPDQQERAVRSICQRAAARVWREGIWLNADGRLSRVSDLKWSVRDMSLLDGVLAASRRQLADVSFLDAACLDALKELPALADSRLGLRTEIKEDGATEDAAETARIQALGGILCRVAFDAADVDATRLHRHREVAARLARSSWLRVPGLDVVPCLDGIPVGNRRAANVVWDDQRLLVTGTACRLFKALVRELTRHFELDQARAVIRECAGRDPEWIEEYAAAHLQLEDAAEMSHVPASSSAPVEAPVGPATHGWQPVVPTREAAPHFDPAPEPSAGEPGDLIAGESDVDEESQQRPAREVRREPRSLGKRARLERFLTSLGFAWSEERSAFVKGPVVVRKRDGVFPWEWVDGGDIQPFWMAESSRDDADGVVLPAEVWNAGITRGSKAVLLEPVDDTFQPYPFAQLAEDVRAARLELFQAEFRLRRRK